MISRDEAERTAKEYEQRVDCWRGHRSEEHETPHWWYFPLCFMGSAGIIIDRQDGRLTRLGSALSLDHCFWGHDRGFSLADDCRFRILQVRDAVNTARFLEHVSVPNPYRGRWPMKGEGPPAGEPPWDFGAQPDLWFQIPAFRKVEPHAWFTYEIGDRRWVDTSVPREPSSDDPAEWPFPDPVTKADARFASGDRVLARATACLARRERTSERLQELAGKWWPGTVRGAVLFRLEVVLDRGERRLLERKDVLPEAERASGQRGGGER